LLPLDQTLEAAHMTPNWGEPRKVFHVRYR